MTHAPDIRPHLRPAVRLTRAALALALVIFCAACSVLRDESAKFPAGRVMSAEEIPKKWEDGSSYVELLKNGDFQANELESEFFQCHPGGVYSKTGKGAWSSAKEMEATTVFLTFEDGCEATLWFGELKGKTTLWKTVKGRDQDLVMLW